MPVTAVPEYLGEDFHDASPALRFGLLLPIWTARADQEADVRKRAGAKSREGQEVASMLQKHGMDAAIESLRARRTHPLPGLWDKNDFGARAAWNAIKVLNRGDRARIHALLDRQRVLAAGIPSECLLALDAKATAPFTTGLGNEHPLENGFAFLNPYGLPYLPASGVKGVLRQAARELAGGEWGSGGGWGEERRFPLLRLEGEQRRPVLDGLHRPVVLSVLDVLFGREASEGDSNHVRGALTFWDVIPRIQGDSLSVEIMTPHQTHYYQSEPRKGMGSASPHDSGQPNPILFLTVPPGSGFAFHVQCDLAHLRRLAPDLAENGLWKALLTEAFQHAFAWCGFGAKTAVGYGAMELDAHACAQREEERRLAQDERDEQRRIASLSPIDRSIAEALKEKIDQGMRDSVYLVQQLENGRWPENDIRAVAERVREMMRDERAWKESSKKPDKDKDYKRTLVVLTFLKGDGT